MPTFLNAQMTTDVLRTDITTQALDVSQVFTNLGLNKNLPIGTVLLFPNDFSYLPSYWVPCIGQTLGKTEWAELYAVIGESFNTGGFTSETDFMLPSLHSTVPAALAAQGGEYFIIGKYVSK